jgi:hypothetical protein
MVRKAFWYALVAAILTLVAVPTIGTILVAAQDVRQALANDPAHSSSGIYMEKRLQASPTP